MKLTLRDLFWLVLVCAVGLGWWADRRVLVKYIRGLQTWIDRHPDGKTIRIHAWRY